MVVHVGLSPMLLIHVSMRDVHMLHLSVVVLMAVGGEQMAPVLPTVQVVRHVEVLMAMRDGVMWGSLFVGPPSRPLGAPGHLLPAQKPR